MRNLSLIVSMLACSVMLAASPPSFHGSANLSYVGKYIFQGRQLAADSLQPSIQIIGDFAYGGVWMNQPIHGSAGRELDLNGGHNFTLNSAWKLDAGTTLYHYYEKDTFLGGRENAFEGYLGLYGSVGGTYLGLYAFRDFTRNATIVQGSAAYSLPLNDWATLRLTASVDSRVPDHGPGYSWGQLGTTIAARISDTAEFTLGAFGQATHHLTGGDKSHLWFTAGLTVNF